MYRCTPCSCVHRQMCARISCWADTRHRASDGGTWHSRTSLGALPARSSCGSSTTKMILSTNLKRSCRRMCKAALRNEQHQQPRMNCMVIQLLQQGRLTLAVLTARRKQQNPKERLCKHQNKRGPRCLHLRLLHRHRHRHQSHRSEPTPPIYSREALCLHVCGVLTLQGQYAPLPSTAFGGPGAAQLIRALPTTLCGMLASACFPPAFVLKC